MYITGVKTYVVKVPYGPHGYKPAWIPWITQITYPYTVIEILTDKGLSGIAGTDCGAGEVKYFVDKVKPVLIGRTLENRQDLEEIWEDVRTVAERERISLILATVTDLIYDTIKSQIYPDEKGMEIRWGEMASDLLKILMTNPSSLMLAFSKIFVLLTRVDDRPYVINVALWDLLGKRRNKPICDLIGRKRDKIKVYASTGLTVSHEPEKIVKFAEECAGNGFEIIKLRAHNVDPEKDLEAIKKVKDAVGDKMSIGVDANQCWTPLPPYWSRKISLKMAKALEEMGIAWLEEPLGGMDIKGIAELSKAVEIRIVGGELECGIDHFKDLINAYDIINPDISMAVGFSDGLKIAEMAKERGKLFTPHTWDLGLGLAAGLQFACSIENCPKLEYPYDPDWPAEYRDSILKEPIVAKNGYLVIPDKPGLGVELNREVLEEYTCEELSSKIAELWRSP